MVTPDLIEGTASQQVPSSQVWRAPDAGVLGVIDLPGLILRGALTAFRAEEDGSVLFHCTDGLPAELAGLVEPFEVADPAEARLTRLEERLDRLSRDLQERERLTDRMDAVEFGLSERLGGMIAEETFNLFAEQAQGPGPSMADRVDELLAALNAQPEAERLGEIAIPALQRVEARLGDLPDLISRLSARVDDLASRPAPQPDLAPMRQANARFLHAMGEGLARLEASVAALSVIRTEDLAQEISALAQAIESRAAPVVSEPDPALSQISRDLDHLIRQIADLSRGLSGATPKIDQMAAQIAPLEGALAVLSQRIEALEQRPDPVLDLTGQRQGFARFSAALGTMTQRVEQAADRWEAAPTPLFGLIEKLDAIVTLQESAKRDALAEAIYALAARVAERELPQAPDLAHLRAAQQDFFQDLRFVLAEIVAGTQRQLAEAS